MSVRPAHYRVVVQIFEMAGCKYARTRGDHMIYYFPGAVRPVVIPKYKEIPVFVIRNNMRVIGLKPQDYLQLLNKVKS